MDLLIVEPLEDEVAHWLASRHTVRLAPELALDAHALRHALYDVRALVIPPSVALDARALHDAPMLKAVGCVGARADQVDVEACARAGVEVVCCPAASAQAEAEFMIGALLSMLRRAPVVGGDGRRMGRELGGSTVGLVGMAPAARALAQLLASFGARVVGYDPALHASDALWARWNVRPVPLRELLAASDAVCVLLQCFSRYRGLLGERFLPFCKPDQVMVSIAHSALFDEHALADVLAGGRLAGAWLDNVAPGVLEDGRPLARLPSLHVTPRVAGATRESRLRGAWAVARRLDELLMRAPAAPGGFRPSAPGAASDLGAGPASR